MNKHCIKASIAGRASFLATMLTNPAMSPTAQAHSGCEERVALEGTTALQKEWERKGGSPMG